MIMILEVRHGSKDKEKFNIVLKQWPHLHDYNLIFLKKTKLKRIVFEKTDCLAKIIVISTSFRLYHHSLRIVTAMGYRCYEE
jgi:hypothetical protein